MPCNYLIGRFCGTLDKVVVGLKDVGFNGDSLKLKDAFLHDKFMEIVKGL